MHLEFSPQFLYATTAEVPAEPRSARACERIRPVGEIALTWRRVVQIPPPPRGRLAALDGCYFLLSLRRYRGACRDLLRALDPGSGMDRRPSTDARSETRLLRFLTPCAKRARSVMIIVVGQPYCSRLQSTRLAAVVRPSQASP